MTTTQKEKNAMNGLMIGVGLGIVALGAGSALFGIVAASALVISVVSFLTA